MLLLIEPKIINPENAQKIVLEHIVGKRVLFCGFAFSTIKSPADNSRRIINTQFRACAQLRIVRNYGKIQVELELINQKLRSHDTLKH